MPSRLRVLALAAWLELVFVVALALGYRYIGERFWGLAALMFVPQLVFGLPIALIAPALYKWGPRRLLWTQAAALVVVLVPLMGLGLGHRHAPGDEHRVVRVLSWNVWFGWGDHDALGRELEEAHADVVLLQAYNERMEDVLRAHLPGYQVRAAGQFCIASRYPLHEIDAPSELAGPPPVRAAHTMYTVDTPAGPLDVVSVHPTSPRDAIDLLREKQHHHQPITHGAPSEFVRNADVRRRQLEAAIAAAASAQHPVVIAGDTNLPAHTWLYRQTLGRYRDLWDEVGFGFGYTFPVKRHLEWMRLDRILAGDGVRALAIEAPRTRGSDHLPVIADLELSPR